ncbi:MAG: lysylphosphatidylglycerol synthase transmembrane domain-containing protein [Thermomonas sp.]
MSTSTSPPRMSPEPVAKKKRWLLAAKALVSFGLLGYMVSRLHWDDLRALPASTPLLLLVALVLNLSALAMMAGRWRLLIEAATGISVPYRHLLRHYLTGSFYNNLLPGAIGGDLVRTKRLIDRHGVPGRIAIKITFFERLVGLCGIVILAGASLPFARIPAGWSRIADRNLLLWASASIATACVVAIVLLLRTLRHRPMGASSLVSVMLLVVLAQLTDAAIVWLFLHAMAIAIAPGGLVFSVCTAYLASMIPISLGGLGVKEGTLAALLAVNGVPAGSALLVPLMLTLTRLMTGTVGAVTEIGTHR